ncbi:Ig-like domain-containing protein [Vibrio scophthalmi]|nr:Ig-like domain-containing protein [Vibrio scophthalmi]
MFISFTPVAVAAELCITPENGETPAIQPSDWLEGQGGSISNLCELRWLSETPAAWGDRNQAVVWVQTADINARATKYWHGGAGFLPIAANNSFRGNYDGQGYNINNLFIYRPNQDKIGLFSTIYGSASNLLLTNVFITGRDSIGALAGFSGGDVNFVRVDGSITATGQAAGGVTGHSSGNSVRGTTADVQLVGEAQIGGLFGVVTSEVMVRDSFSLGSATGWGSVGGIVGSDQSFQLHIQNSYSALKVIGCNGSCGGIVSNVKDPSLILENSYFDCEIGGVKGDNTDCWDGQTGEDSFGRTTAQLHDPLTFIAAGWGQGTPWQSGTWRLEQSKYPQSQHPNTPLFSSPSEVEAVYTLREDNEFQLEISASSVSGDTTVEYQLVNAPDWFMINENGVINATANHLQVGYYPNVVITAISGNYSNTLPMFSLNVSEVNDQPHLAIGHLGVINEGVAQLDLLTLVNDEIGEARDYRYEIDQPQFGAVTLSGSTITYTHTVSNELNDSFIFTLVDGEHRVSGKVEIEIHSAPTLINGVATLDEDSQLTYDLSALAVGIVSPQFEFVPPQNGTARLIGTILAYTPNRNYHGSDELIISEKTLSLNATLSLTIRSLSDPLVVANSNLSLDEDRTITIDLSTLVTDVDDQALSYRIETPDFGQAVLTGAEVVYTPDANYNGVDRLNFTVSDGVRPSAQGAIEFNVRPINDSPETRSEIYSTYQEIILDLSVLVTDVDGSLPASSYVIVTPPNKGTLEQIESTTQWRYTPNGELGEDSFVFAVQDGEFAPQATVTMHVTTAPQEPTYDAQERGVITNLANLRWLSEQAGDSVQNKSWVLSDNIDASETRFWDMADTDNLPSTLNVAQGFKPISIDIVGFDGAGHTISGLYIYRPFEKDVGLFGSIQIQNVSNLQMVGSDILGESRVGLLFGNINGYDAEVMLTDIHLDGDICGTSSVGGVTGWLSSPAKMVRVGVEMRIKQECRFINNSSGGAVGYSFSTLSVLESAIHVSSDSPLDGGVFGSAHNGSETELLTLKNSFVSVPSVDGFSRGMIDSSHSYFNCELTSNDSCDSNSSGRTTKQLKTASTFIGEDWRWDAQTPWQQGGWLLKEGEYPQLRRENVPLFASPDNAIVGEQTDEDSVYQRQFSANPTISGAPISYVISSLVPEWLTIDGNGLLSGTPNNDDVGTVKDVVVQVTQGNLVNKMLPFDITVNNVNDAPTISGIPATYISQGQAYHFVPTANDIDLGDTLAFFISSQPSWATFDSKTGALSGTPQNGDVGYHTGISILVSDGDVFVALPTFSITVENVNDAPSITGSPVTSVQQDAPYIFTPTADDIDVGDKDKLVFSITNLPVWAQFDEKTGRLSGTPLNEHVGTTSGIVISVSDGIETASLPAFSITVKNVNDAPTITGSPVTSVQQDALYNFTPTADDVDVGDKDKLVFSITNIPVWAQFDAKTGRLSGTPLNEHVGTTSGIVIAVSDGIVTTSLATFAITVENVNDAPVISGVPPSYVDQEQSYFFTPSAIDIDSGSVLTFSIKNQPEWTDFNASSGRLSGIPRDEDVGKTEGIEISVSDGEYNASIGPFSIEVLDVNDGPSAVLDIYSFAEPQDGERYRLSVMENDYHLDGYAMSIVNAHSDKGSVSINGETLVLFLDAPYEQVNLNYYLEDSEGLVSEAQVAVSIVRVSDIVFDPIEDLDVNATGKITEVALNAPSAFDRNGEAVAVELVGNATHFSSGLHILTWKAEDGDGQQAAIEQILRIHPLVNLPRSIQVEKGTSEYPVDVMLNGELPQDTLTVPYMLNGIEQSPIQIKNAQKGVIPLKGLLSGERYVVELDAGLNVGRNNQFTLDVAEKFIMPQVTSQLTQKGETRTWLCQQQGKAMIEVSVVNAGINEQFTITPLDQGWIVEEQSDRYARFSAEASSLTVGPLAVSFDVVNLTAEMSGEQVSINHALYLDVAPQLAMLDNDTDSDGDGIPDGIEGYKDSDGDGIPDYLDAIDSASAIPSYLQDQDRYLVEVASGITVSPGMTEDSTVGRGALLDKALPSDNAGLYQHGVFDFVLTGLSSPGELVSVVLPQQEVLPENASYRKYIRGEWVDFVDDGDDSLYPNGSIRSTLGQPGICPPPDVPDNLLSVWTSGLTEGHWCVQLSIRDGGLNDADGIANASIVDPGGVVTLYQAPIANDDTVTIESGEQAVIKVLENDINESSDDPLTISQVSALRGEASHDGEFVYYTPPVNTTGEFVVHYTVTDSYGMSATAKVTVTVICSDSSSGASLGALFLLLLMCVSLYRRKYM